jgi:protein-tyrosine kinase
MSQFAFLSSKQAKSQSVVWKTFGADFPRVLLALAAVVFLITNMHVNAMANGLLISSTQIEKPESQAPPMKNAKKAPRVKTTIEAPPVPYLDRSDVKNIMNGTIGFIDEFFDRGNDLKSLFGVVALSLFAAFLSTDLTCSKAKSSSIIQTEAEKTAVPHLPLKYKVNLAKNSREMSTVQGNIIGANRNVKTIYVTSCFNSEGKTTTSLSVAHALSADGTKRVLLVDGNQRSPMIHKLYGTQISPGLMDLIDSNTDFELLFKQTEHKNLFILPFGSISPDGQNRLTEDMLKHRLGAISEKFDFTIFDGNSVLGTSDTLIIAHIFDGVLIVVECEKTKWEVVQMVSERIGATGGTVLGIVLNKRKYYIPKILYGKI